MSDSGRGRALSRRPLRVATFNLQDFYLLLDRAYTRREIEELAEGEYQAMNASIYNRNKNRGKVAEVARQIIDEDLDLIGLCEVGGMESLEAFNRAYLGGRYDCFLHETNSRRGIFVGALARRDRLPGCRAVEVPGPFSRNLLKLSLGAEGGDLEVFVVHLKSQHGADRGIERRIREVERLASLVRNRRALVMGDFNGILLPGEEEFEYRSFLDLGLRDVLEAVGVPPDLRRTHYHFGPAPNFVQLDYIFCSTDIEVLEARAVEGEIPINRSQRDRLPSDHLMVSATLMPARPGPRDVRGLMDALRDLFSRRRGR
jgi:endonuclease/exonuclease/phosphatase family metal-dependent hydrolase